MSSMPAAAGSPQQRVEKALGHPLAPALIVLTFTTGLIDAVSYLGLGRVFTANMTGNVVLLGFGLAGSGGLPVLAPLVSLAAFLAGAALGGALAARLPDQGQMQLVRALAIEVALVGVATVLAAVVAVRTNAVSGDTLIALLALAMGIRNATVRRLGVPDLTTTVLTMTLTGLAADGRSSPARIRRLAAVLAMLAGALAGALLLESSLALPLAAAAGVALVTWLALARPGRPPAQAAR
jgi:uncharacterized membrane protein YoaK (UPF0700 family)